MPFPIRLLLIENSPTHPDALASLIRLQAPQETTLERVDSLSGALQWLEERAFDLIFLDLKLADAEGLPVFEAVSEGASDTPIVVLAHPEQVDLAAQALPLGALDYLVRDELQERALGRAIRHAIEAKKVRLKAQEMRKRKSEFVAMVSHELRNPMTGVMGFIHLLTKTDLDEVQREYVMAAQKGANSLLELLNGLLDLSNAESGHISLKLESLDLRECLESVVILSAPQARSKGLEMVASIDPAIPDRVLADSLRLRQVLVNLLGNAIKFTDSGQVILRARIRTSTAQEVVVRFAVEDTGRGIPAHQHKLIFQAFGQAHSTDRACGSGLGLAIARELIGAMGGVLGLDSEVGKGSHFWFDLHFSVEQPSRLLGRLQNQRVLVLESHLPTRRALLFALRKMGATVSTEIQSDCDLIVCDAPRPDLPRVNCLVCSHDRTLELPELCQSVQRPIRLTDLLLTPPTPSPLQESPSRESFSGSGGRVLVVDDDPLCRQLAQALARGCGFECDGAEDGACAERMVGARDYCFVLIDHHLPDCTGQQLARRLLQSGCRANLISLSGSKVCAPEFSGCLQKPLQPAALEELLQQPPAIDWQVLDRFKRYQTGTQPSLIRQLVETYTHLAPRRAAALRRAIREGRNREVRRVAHQLKGAAASVGAVAVAAAAGHVEEAPSEAGLVGALNVEVMRSLRIFRQYLRELLSDSTMGPASD